MLCVVCLALHWQLDGIVRFDSSLSALSSPPANLLLLKRVSWLRLLGGGSGALDGQGGQWWADYRAGNSRGRPTLLRIDSAEDTAIDGITLL